MKLEYANLICPKCGNANYMRYLIGKNVGSLNVKCINCNSYFSSSELLIEEKPKLKTNSDKIREMTDEELAKFLSLQMIGKVTRGWTSWLDWLKKEAE